MIVRRTIDKDELKELPKTVFPGRIYVIQSEAETEKAVAYLQSRPVIGIDSETRPSFTKGQSHKVALSPNKAVSNYRTMCVNSEYRTKVCKRFTPSYSKKKYPNHNACPTGKLMY